MLLFLKKKDQTYLYVFYFPICCELTLGVADIICSHIYYVSIRLLTTLLSCTTPLLIQLLVIAQRLSETLDFALHISAAGLVARTQLDSEWCMAKQGTIWPREKYNYLPIDCDFSLVKSFAERTPCHLN